MSETITLPRPAFVACVRALIVGALLLVGFGTVAGYYASNSRTAEGQRVDAVAQAKGLGQQVVLDVCQSTDPVDQARFAGLCLRAREAAAKPGPEGPPGPRGPAGEEPSCNSLPTRCVGPQGAPGMAGPPGRDGVDGVSPPCLSEPAACRGADGSPGETGARGEDGAAGPQGPIGPPGESNPCPGHWEATVLLDGRTAYICYTGPPGTN